MAAGARRAATLGRPDRSALASAIHGAPSAGEGTRDTGALFAQAPPGRPRPAAAFAFGVLAVGSIAALVVVLSGSRNTAGTPLVRDAPAQAVAQADILLELVALTHDRDADRLVVRGIVRNPPGGAGLTHLTAVVQLFDRDGGVVATGRAEVDSRHACAGYGSAVRRRDPERRRHRRYRVSFRTDERVIPHVDRRDRMMAAAQEP